MATYFEVVEKEMEDYSVLRAKLKKEYERIRLIACKNEKANCIASKLFEMLEL